jgi:hypothetical protein
MVINTASSVGTCSNMMFSYLDIEKRGTVLHLILADNADRLENLLLSSQALSEFLHQTSECLDTRVESLLARSSPTLELS